MAFEKIRNELQNKAFERYNNYGMGGEMVVALDDVIDTIHQVEAEYNNGWISVDDRLPEDDGVYIISCVDSIRGARHTAVGYLSLEHPKHKWWDVESEYIYFDNVIAWQPLPQPPKGE